MVHVNSIPKHHFSRFINCWYNKTHLLNHWNVMPSIEKIYLAVYPYVVKGVVFFQLPALSQWTTPFYFMISFDFSPHIHSCLPRVHFPHISQKNLLRRWPLDMWKKITCLRGIWAWKADAPSGWVLPLYSYAFFPIFSVKYFSEKLWLCV